MSYEGITPAHAGKSNRDVCPGIPSRDHPRTCGEKETPRCSGCRRLGSPPHMRGKGG